jgi:hypothetical protein
MSRKYYSLYSYLVRCGEMPLAEDIYSDILYCMDIGTNYVYKCYLCKGKVVQQHVGIDYWW